VQCGVGQHLIALYLASIWYTSRIVMHQFNAHKPSVGQNVDCRKSGFTSKSWLANGQNWLLVSILYFKIRFYLSISSLSTCHNFLCYCLGINLQLRLHDAVFGGFRECG
jgi:hypothetical protein